MDDRHQHYALHQQQLHHQQQQQNPQQQVYSAHSQILPSSHHHPQPHPLTVQPVIHPPQYHHDTHSPSWGGSSQGQPQPRGQYDAEHLFSAVQQQLESMRDHDRDENNSSQAAENVEHHGTETANNPNTASSADQLQDAANKAADLSRPEVTAVPPAASAVPTASPTVTPPASAVTPPASSASTSMPTLYNTPRQNQEATGSEGQKEPESQTDSEKDKEKGVVWQTLVIGGKKVRYKVLGNVKVSKGSPVTGKILPSGKVAAVVPPTQTEDGSPVSAGNKSGTGTPVKAPRPLKIVKLLPPGAKVTKPANKKDKEATEKEQEKNTEEQDVDKSAKPSKNGEKPVKNVEGTEPSKTSAGKKSKGGDDRIIEEIKPLSGTKDKKAVKQKRKSRTVAAQDKDTLKKKGALKDGDTDYVSEQKQDEDYSPKKRRSTRPRKPVLIKEWLIPDEDTSEQELDEDSPASVEFVPSKKLGRRAQRSIRMTRWSFQEIRALVGFLISAKKAGLYKKEWPTLKETESFWERAADCCNVVRLDKKKRSGAACAHWTHCYLKPKYITTSKMRFYFNSTEFNAPPNQYNLQMLRSESRGDGENGQNRESQKQNQTQI
ncbi:uncharacterized protein [Amphiura filiformis]|uniref:uncharacterized protein isoform X2 n=1 Tax=Amphiura filiformis TaxID=82378 RepID=UPI003B20C2BC